VYRQIDKIYKYYGHMYCRGNNLSAIQRLILLLFFKENTRKESNIN